jgi:4,5-dihydroxyphthalate decarboxylase
MGAMSQETRVLKTAIGRTAYTEPLFSGAVTSPSLRLAFEPFPTIYRAFAPMVRELAFDVSELAMATLLQAKAAGKRIKLLPIVLVGRFQQGAMLCLKSSSLRSEADLKGRRVGVRSYTQTSGMWLRGIIEDHHGIKAHEMRWVTFEGAHVTEFKDPPWVERAAPGKEMLAMLRAGELDAVIVGTEMPEGDDLRPVFADPKAAAEAFFAQHGFMPANHLLTMRQDIAEQDPKIADELVRLFGGLKAGAKGEGLDPRPIGRAAIDPSLKLALRYCTAQGLLARSLSLDEVWG